MLLGYLVLGKHLPAGILSGHKMESRNMQVLDIPFLKGLTQEQCDLLLHLFEPFSVPAGIVIFKQGDPALYLYLISSGRVAIRYKPYDGPKITLNRLRNGGIFGWSSVIGNKAYTSDAISTSPLEAFRLRGMDLRNLCLEHPDAGRDVLQKLAEAVSPRWKNARDQIRDMLQNMARVKTSKSVTKR